MKKINELLEKLKNNIEELQILKNEFFTKNNFEEIEINLMINKTLSVYEYLILLKASLNKETDNKVEHENKETNILDNINETIFEIQEQSSIKIDTEKIEKKEEKEDIDHKKTESKKTLADKFKSDKEYLYEKLAFKKNDNTVLLFSKPINDLNKVIGLNEKYAIIKELMNGDSNKYNEVINKLNNLTNFHEAYNFITKELKWDTNQHIVKYLLDLLRRKFIVKNE